MVTAVSHLHANQHEMTLNYSTAQTQVS